MECFDKVQKNSLFVLTVSVIVTTLNVQSQNDNNISMTKLLARAYQCDLYGTLIVYSLRIDSNQPLVLHIYIYIYIEWA